MTTPLESEPQRKELHKASVEVVSSDNEEEIRALPSMTISFSQRFTTEDLLHAGLSSVFTTERTLKHHLSDANVFLPEDMEQKQRFLKKKSATIRTSDEETGVSMSFQFIEYCPEIFRYVRECSNVGQTVYKEMVEEPYKSLRTNSKSGQFFMISESRRLIVKTISKKEYRIFRNILPAYYAHLKDNPSSLLVRIYGLYRLHTYRPNRNLYFIIMRNIAGMEGSHPIHKAFDLKGSYQGRFTREKDHLASLDNILKDQNFSRIFLSLGPRRTELFLGQVRQDLDFLQKAGLMDYSLYVGVHYINRCDADHDQFTTDDDHVDFNCMRSTIPKSNAPGNVIYTFGIIDLFTCYKMKKRLEHFFKSFIHSDMDISAVNPALYADRLYAFIKGHFA